jgi:hypothetical protein
MPLAKRAIAARRAHRRCWLEPTIVGGDHHHRCNANSPNQASFVQRPAFTERARAAFHWNPRDDAVDVSLGPRFYLARIVGAIACMGPHWILRPPGTRTASARFGVIVSDKDTFSYFKAHYWDDLWNNSKQSAISGGSMSGCIGGHSP